METEEQRYLWNLEHTKNEKKKKYAVSDTFLNSWIHPTTNPKLYITLSVSFSNIFHKFHGSLFPDFENTCITTTNWYIVEFGSVFQEIFSSNSLNYAVSDKFLVTVSDMLWSTISVIWLQVTSKTKTSLKMHMALLEYHLYHQSVVPPSWECQLAQWINCTWRWPL